MFQQQRLTQSSIDRYGGVARQIGKLARALSFLSLLALAGCEALPRVKVSPVDGTTTSEGGASVKLRVSLADRPATAVEVRAVSSDESEGKVSTPIVFDATNFAQAQELTVTGVDDAQRDGDVSYDVDIYARSTVNDRSWLVKRVHLLNRDDDVPTFEPIGHLPGATESVATAVSADGSVVVGWSGTGAPDQAFRWTDQGLVGLGGDASRAEAISPDGTKIVGSVADARFEHGRAAVSFAPGQPPQVLADPSPHEGVWLHFVDGTAALDDGTVFGTCIQPRAYGESQGCKKGADLVPVGGTYLYAADGAHFAGTQYGQRFAPFSTRALLDSQLLSYPPQLLCDPPTGCEAAIRAFAAGASVLVGTSKLPITFNGPKAPFAIRYEASEGMVKLPDLDGGELDSGAYAISADGRVIGGWGSDERGQQATLWIDRTPHALEDYLLEQGGTLPDGWSLLELRALSSDGRVLVGNGLNPQGEAEGFRVRLP